MKSHLFFQFTMELVAANKKPQPPKKVRQRFHSLSLSVLQYTPDRGDHYLKLRKLFAQLLAPSRSQRVITSPAVGFRLFPFAFHPSLKQQPLQRRIQRALLNRQYVLRNTLDRLSDSVAVQRG